MYCSRVPHDHTDTRSSTLPGRVSLIVLAVSYTASCILSFSRMYGIGSLFCPLPHSHSWALSLSGTALLNVILSRTVPSLAPMNRVLKKLFGACFLNSMILVSLMDRGVGTHCSINNGLRRGEPLGMIDTLVLMAMCTGFVGFDSRDNNHLVRRCAW